MQFIFTNPNPSFSPTFRCEFAALKTKTKNPKTFKSKKAKKSIEVQTVDVFLALMQASRKWLGNLIPSPGKRQQSPVHKHGMTEEDVEMKVREVVMARFYSLAKVCILATRY